MDKIVIIILVIVWIGMRQLKERPVKINTLWIVPAFLIYACAGMIGKEFFVNSYAPIIMTIAFFVGCIVGLIRGIMTKVKFNPIRKEVTMKSSIIGFIIWISILVIKLVTREVSSDVDLATGAFLMLGLSSIVIRRVWIYFAYVKETKQLAIRKNHK